MAMSVTYATVNGVLVEENRNGDVTTYISDTLGSVIKTVNESGTVTSSAVYWPYGEVNTSTGTNPSSWGYVGTLGYFRDSLARIYVRERVYIINSTRWLSEDPLWPQEHPYSYAYGDPCDTVDPFGMAGCTKGNYTSCAAKCGGGQNIRRCQQNSRGQRTECSCKRPVPRPRPKPGIGRKPRPRPRPGGGDVWETIGGALGDCLGSFVTGKPKTAMEHCLDCCSNAVAAAGGSAGGAVGAIGGGLIGGGVGSRGGPIGGTIGGFIGAGVGGVIGALVSAKGCQGACECILLGKGCDEPRVPVRWGGGRRIRPGERTIDIPLGEPFRRPCDNSPIYH